MQYTFESILVQKNANKLINELLCTLDEEAFDGYRTTGDSLSALLKDEFVWDVTKWADEETMNEYKLQVEILRRLFDWSEMFESQEQH